MNKVILVQKKGRCNIRKLLNIPRPDVNESIRGYFHRTAAEFNGYSETIWLYQIVGWQRYNKSLNMLFPTEIYDFRQAKEIFTLEEDAFRNMIVAYRLTSNYDLLPNNLKQVLNSFGSCTVKPRICPLCVVDKTIHQIYWELSLFTSCPLHNCLLIDECERCGKHISTVKINVSNCECGFDFKNSKIMCVEGEFSKYIKRVLERENQGGIEILDRLTPEKLYYLFIYSVRWALVTLGEKMRSRSTEPLKTGMLYEACEIALSIYEDWPNTFYSFIDNYRYLMRKSNKKSKSNITHRLFNKFDGTEEFEFIKSAIQEYSELFWSNGFSQKLELKPKVKETVREELSGRMVSKILGISVIQIKNIVTKGILIPKKGPMVDGSTEYSFSEKDVTGFIEDIEARTIHRDVDSKITFRAATVQCYEYDLTLVDFLLMLKEKKILPCDINKEVEGLDKFYFSLEELKRLLLGDHIGVSEIATEMSVKKNSVERWVSLGLIKVAETKKAGKQLIKLSDYYEFRKNYVPAVEIVKKGKISFKSTEKLLRELKKADITPVNKKECGDDLYLLKRSEQLNEFIQSHSVI